MSLTQAQFRTELREHLGLDSTELPDADADLLLNRSFWEIAKKFKFRLKETEETFATVDGTRVHSFPSGYQSIERVILLPTDVTLNIQLLPLNFDEAAQNKDDDSDSRGQPTHYFIRGDELWFFPIPDDAYSITIYYKQTLGDIITAGTGLPEGWDDAVLFSSVFRGHARLGNTSKASSFRQMAKDILDTLPDTETEEKVDTQYAQVQSLRPRYP